MGGLPGAPGSCPRAIKEEDVSQMTGLFRGGAGGTCTAAGDDGPCPVNC